MTISVMNNGIGNLLKFSRVALENNCCGDLNILLGNKASVEENFQCSPFSLHHANILVKDFWLTVNVSIR